MEADNNEEYADAFRLYSQALELFTHHCKYDKNPSSVATINKKMHEYMDRAEYLKALLASNTRTDANAGPGASSTTAVGQVKKPAAGTDHDAERDKLKQQLSSAIVSEKPNVKWDDVSGLEHAKDALKEAVILPVKFPQVRRRRPSPFLFPLFVSFFVFFVSFWSFSERTPPCFLFAPCLFFLCALAEWPLWKHRCRCRAA